MSTSLQEQASFFDSVRIPVRLASKTSSDWPIVVSLWYLHEGGKLYCATQQSAKIVSYLQHDNRVGFEIAEDRPPYCGVRGQAVASIDQTLGLEILNKLLQRYLGGTDSSLAQKLLANAEHEVAIVLEPVQVFTWNFSKRMQDLAAGPGKLAPKVCP